MSAPDLLETIVAGTRRSVETRRLARPIDALEREAVTRSPRGREFGERLARRETVNVIAECKRRSPSKGVLRAEYDPVALGAAYERGGAAAISVLTEPTFFDGALEHLGALRAAVSVPLLRKDFIVDEYQILEAREAGADAVLLIVAALPPDDLERLLRVAAAHGLAALVEVHDETELDRALDAGATIVGVNNRNLRTLATDRSVSRRLVDRIPERVTAVAESGLRTADELHDLRSAGYAAFLIGEGLVTTSDPETAVRRLVAVHADRRVTPPRTSR